MESALGINTLMIIVRGQKLKILENNFHDLLLFEKYLIWGYTNPKLSQQLDF